MSRVEAGWQGSPYHTRGMAACAAIIKSLKEAPDPPWLSRRSRGSYMLFRGKWRTEKGPWAACWWRGDGLEFTGFHETADEAEAEARKILGLEVTSPASPLAESPSESPPA